MSKLLTPKKIIEIDPKCAYLKKINGVAILDTNPKIGEEYIELPIIAGG